MKRTRVLLRSSLVAALCGVFAAPALADEGMWLFNRPPKKQIQQKYGFELTDAWLEHVQKSCVRLPNGSGSLVSANGLVMTNHHVGSGMLQKLSNAQRDLLVTGYSTNGVEPELKCADMEVHVLWTIEDVTERVNGAVTAGMANTDANAAKRDVRAKIEEEASKKSGMKCETVELYQGGRYHLYSYKRYSDVRLVMAPESGVAAFGGDPDNFEFPRYCLDMTFFRIYENDKPLRTEHYLKWSRNGATDNELVFVAGHPGRTSRLFTVDHLKYLRDFSFPLTMRSLWRREVQLATFMGRSDEHHRIATGDHHGVQNARKARTGTFAGLMDPAVFAAKTAAETKLRAAVDANPQWKQQWGDAWSTVAQCKQAQREFAVRLSALGGSGLSLGGQLFGKASTLVRMADEMPKESGARLREFRNSNKDSLELQLYSPAPIYPELEIENLCAGLQQMVELLGGEDPTVVKVLDGNTPQARAAELVRGTRLLDVAERKRVAAAGKAEIDASKDPLIRLAASLDAENRTLRKRFEDEVDTPEKLAYAKVAAAGFAVNGEDQYPDATFSLRLSYGTVRGWEENGGSVAPFTNVEGLYGRADERGNVEPFVVPASWKTARPALNANTPFNFVTTCDIIGGNSGSPTINKAGEVVGLIFDGNIHSLIGDIAYDDKIARAVSVDSRVILESLRKVYGCAALADEIAGGSPN